MQLKAHQKPGMLPMSCRANFMLLTPNHGVGIMQCAHSRYNTEDTKTETVKALK